MTKEEIKIARAKIRDYAHSLGICSQCRLNEHLPNIKYCARCKELNNKAKDKARHNPINCSKCARKLGKEELESGRKTCLSHKR